MQHVGKSDRWYVGITRINKSQYHTEEVILKVSNDSTDKK